MNTAEDENSVLEIQGNMLLLSVDTGVSGSYDIVLKNIPADLVPEEDIITDEKQADKVKPEDLTKKTEKKKTEKKKPVPKKEKKEKTAKQKKTAPVVSENPVFVIDVTSSGIDDIQNIPLKILLFDSLKEWSNPVDTTVVSPDSNNKIEIKTSGKIKRIVIIPGDDSVDGFAEEYIINKHGAMTGSLKLTKTEDREFKIHPVYFNFNSSEIQLQDIPYLHDLIDYMRKNSNLKIRIEGYSDSHGTDRANMEISIKRAEKVRDYLVKSGIESSRITTKGHGFTSRTTGDTSQQKRRVDFILSE